LGDYLLMILLKTKWIWRWEKSLPNCSSFKGLEVFVTHPKKLMFLQEAEEMNQWLESRAPAG
jgi:hypothetical protein